MSQTRSDSKPQKDQQGEAVNLYNIAAGQPFLPTLARALFDDTQRSGLFGPCRLEEVQILLPTRRAARMLASDLLAEAAKHGRDALLLPRIDTLGDLDENLVEDLFDIAPDMVGAALNNPADDELPAAIDKMARHFHLLPLVEKWAALGGLGGAGGTADDRLNPVKLAALVHDLEAFLDQTQNEQAKLDRLENQAPDDLAENWQHIVSLLNIVLRYWPEQLNEMGQMDPTARRNALLDRRRRSWQKNPPTHPILAAGSTGSIRATADLLSLIARLPRGAVLLPGLDEAADDNLWRAIGKDPAHPQYALASLLEHMQAVPESIKRFPGSAPAAPRVEVLNRALVPAEQTANWAAFDAIAQSKNVFEGLTLIEAPDMRAEAGAIALAMRGVLETPDKTAALVTRDRNLARRVAAELKRWDINIDDTAGQPLSNLPRARLLRLILQARNTHFAPVDMLAVLKHPLVCLGQSRRRHLAHVRVLENAVLRGPQPFGGLDGLRAALAQSTTTNDADKQKAAALLTRLEMAFDPFDALPEPATMSAQLTALHESAAHLLSADPNEEEDDDEDKEEENGARTAILFASDEEGRALRALFDALHEHSALAPTMTAGDFAPLFDMWLMRQSVRRQAPGQPRLAILGPLEARLMQADVMILGGLNETAWPPMPETGPWLSRPMRNDLGMSQPERQIGQAAHDFVQAAAAPEVYLTRAQKIDGAPSVAARWLRRLETLAGKLPRHEGDALVNWWQTLDRSAAAPEAESAPRPCPPVAARPRQLSVTQIETLLHNPYEIYAKKILRLRALDAVDAPPNAAHRGIFVHRLMERFIAEEHHLKENAADAFLALAQEEQTRHAGGAALMQFWQARLAALAYWLDDYETKRAHELAASFVELSGTLAVDDFTLTAKADRLDLLSNGGFDIIDYKTGSAPPKSRVTDHLAPQLTLEAAILRDGRFGAGQLTAGQVPLHGATRALTYLRLSGRTPAAEPTSFEASNDLLDGALAMLRQLIALYDDPAQPYLVHIRPQNRFGTAHLTDRAFDHLARCPEWHEEDN